jgi:pseudaminic acid synthase
MMQQLAIDFKVKIGLSDHTLGSTVPVIATALGAEVIEKHFILDRSIGGPDASFSMNEIEFTAMVKAIREAEVAVGTSSYELSPKQVAGKDFSRSLYVAEAINKGEIITEKSIRSVRPGFSLHPKHLPEILGLTATRDLKKGERITLSDFE